VIHFSSRVGPEQCNSIAQAEMFVRAGGHKLVSVNDSNPTRHGLAPREVPSFYTADPRGPLSTREQLSDFLEQRSVCEGFRRAVDSAKLYLLSSTSQAYSWLFKLLCDSGDVVLAPKPGYPLIESIGRLENVRTLEYQLSYDGSWFIDMASIERLLDGSESGRVRAIVVINPNNPTGSYVKPQERERLIALCREHDVAIIADEVFFDYALEPFEGNRRFAGEQGVLTFELDGFSKLLAAPHAKVGWIEVSGPEDVVIEAQRRLDIIADDYLPFSDIISQRMPELLAAVPSQLGLVRERTQVNLKELDKILNEDANGLVSVLRSEGGWNVLLRFPSVIDEDALVLRLIEDFGLTGQPGYFFDMTSNGYLALSLLPELADFKRNVHAVLTAVEREIEL
jgi:alanine-synthesizing transaminase